MQGYRFSSITRFFWVAGSITAISPQRRHREIYGYIARTDSPIIADEGGCPRYQKSAQETSIRCRSRTRGCRHDRIGSEPVRQYVHATVGRVSRRSWLGLSGVHHAPTRSFIAFHPTSNEPSSKALRSSISAMIYIPHRTKLVARASNHRDAFFLRIRQKDDSAQPS
jgi:hypothetical protein